MTIKVTNDEIKKYDPMIHLIIQKEILPYWTHGKGKRIYANQGMTIGRLGMDIDDLVQFGRMVVFKQTQWYKKHKKKKGKKGRAKLSTLMYKYLRNKFISLSHAHTWAKRGGPIMKVEESRANIEYFINHFNPALSVKQNKQKLIAAIVHSKLDKLVAARQHDNAKLLKYAQKMLLNVHKNWTIQYSEENINENSPNEIYPTPETELIAKEAIHERLNQYCKEKSLKSLTLQEYLQMTNNVLKPKYLAANKSYLIMKLAKKRGITSQRQLAYIMGIGTSTLSNILRGRSNGTVTFRKQAKKMFGLSMSELKKVVNSQNGK